jgi:hypothetical protein
MDVDLTQWLDWIAGRNLPPHPPPLSHRQPAIPKNDPRDLYSDAVRALERQLWPDAERLFLRYAVESVARAADGFAGAGRTCLHLSGPSELTLNTLTPLVSPDDRRRAAVHYRQALSVDPAHVRALVGLSRTLPVHDPQRAALLTRALTHEDGLPLHLMLGDARRAAGEFDAALLAYERAVARYALKQPPFQARVIDLLLEAGHVTDANTLRRAFARAMSTRFGPDGAPTPTRIRRKGQQELPTPPGPVWGVIANVREHAHPPNSGLADLPGTKHFAPGAKVYLLEPMWGSGGEDVEVVGRHRHGHRFISIVTRTRYLEDARAKLVYSPHVIRELRGIRDGSEESKARCEELARWLNARDG